MKKLILILTAAVMAVSCSDNLEDLNQNIKDPTNVSGESLFASAQKQLADQFVTPNVNLNNLRLWTQQLQETTYLDESQYDQITRAIPDNHWRELYRDVLKDLNEADRVIAATDNDLTNALKPNKLAIVEVMTVFAYSNLVETYGDVPYSEALDIENLLPAYDDAATIYKDLLTRLDAAISSMDTSVGSFSDTEDMMYSGNVENWKKFANSLKLRMGIMLADVNPALSQSTVESAYTSGVFTSNADNGSYMYRPAAPNNNPMNDNLVLSGRNDYVAAKTIIDLMNDLEDPRREVYFTTVDGEYIGGVIGEISAYAEHSHVADRLVDPAEPGVLLSYAEVRFLLAEAAARGYAVGGDAATHYEAAITASFEYWGAEGLSDYLASPAVDYDTAIANSSSSPAWKQVIGTQAYLGLYNRTFASYNSIRRLDYPILVEPTDAETGFPTRYLYPVGEQTLNEANWSAASSAIGGDAAETRLFWDKFYTFDF
ncbi:SusD/RagB family nutrient-binding outer membrane lipoprotein [Aequorivita sp. 609]|uniref:SusD/RagB family nutrient-binding outer membrane lipoprotein n=1 Tax=Aequorivita xiaoshiensis TaxID=2874476 RepID=A0A9X1R2K5_9FLAO|nr:MULTISPECIES: SusD/RagB family nutrient-binding outer membrane lipoprotein [Aequorivita]MBB6680666.1 SusD/RagB family nutrient-binding outer membrane lipoprotein [Aequorivita sp. 609]MCG2431134.1 SusD/RagB family nutrient-binding outer membrane lipoprotein [Aequorivita xiaoshiensis]